MPTSHNTPVQPSCGGDLCSLGVVQTAAGPTPAQKPQHPGQQERGWGWGRQGFLGCGPHPCALSLCSVSSETDQTLWGGRDTKYLLRKEGAILPVLMKNGNKYTKSDPLELTLAGRAQLPGLPGGAAGEGTGRLQLQVGGTVLVATPPRWCSRRQRERGAGKLPGRPCTPTAGAGPSGEAAGTGVQGDFPLATPLKCTSDRKPWREYRGLWWPPSQERSSIRLLAGFPPGDHPMPPPRLPALCSLQGMGHAGLPGPPGISSSVSGVTHSLWRR